MDPKQGYLYQTLCIQNYPAQGGVAFILISSGFVVRSDGVYVWWFNLVSWLQVSGCVERLRQGRIRCYNFTVRLIGSHLHLIVGLGYLLAFFDKEPGLCDRQDRQYTGG